MLWVVAIFEESIRKWVYIDNRQEANKSFVRFDVFNE